MYVLGITTLSASTMFVWEFVTVSILWYIFFILLYYSKKSLKIPKGQSEFV